MAKNAKEIKVDDLECLIDFIVRDKHINAISIKSVKGLRGVKDVILQSLVDFWSAVLLHKKSFPKIPGITVRKFDWSEYVKHIRRCFLLEVWNITENRVREIAEESNLKIMGSQESLKKKIDYVCEIIDNSEAQKMLTEIKDDLSSNFIEFPRILSRVIKERCSKEDKEKWERFFADFRIMRNAAHTNFIVDRNYKLKTDWTDKEFKKGKAINFLQKDIKNIMVQLMVFFTMIEESS